jgi:hypothetical protein
MQNFNPQRLPTLNLNIPTAQSAYSPAALSAALSASSNATGRTVYVGNLPATASVDELLNLVHFGPLESIRVLPEKSCVFLSFLDGATAAAFHADATIKKLSLHGQELKIGWGKPSPVPAQVALAISQSNASRNVYLGGLDESMTEEQLRDDLSRFGLIDQVKIVRDKNIGFVHFLSIAVATKVMPQSFLSVGDACSRAFNLGGEHTPNGACMGGQTGQLRQGSLCIHSQVAASCRAAGPSRGSAVSGGAVCNTLAHARHTVFTFQSLCAVLPRGRPAGHGWSAGTQQDSLSREHTSRDHSRGSLQCDSWRSPTKHTVHGG